MIEAVSAADSISRTRRLMQIAYFNFSSPVYTLTVGLREPPHPNSLLVLMVESARPWVFPPMQGWVAVSGGSLRSVCYLHRVDSVAFPLRPWMVSIQVNSERRPKRNRPDFQVTIAEYEGV